MVLRHIVPPIFNVTITLYTTSCRKKLAIKLLIYRIFQEPMSKMEQLVELKCRVPIYLYSFSIIRMSSGGVIELMLSLCIIIKFTINTIFRIVLGTLCILGPLIHSITLSLDTR